MFLWNSYWDYSYWNKPQEYEIWPDAGRTYYMGVKTNLDFDRLKVPSWSDLTRMQRRLYGAVRGGVSSFTGMGSWMQDLVRF